VDQSFAAGAVLLDGTGRNYSINTSRRTDPGQAEIHNLDTDIFYLLDGSATLVTGGTAVEAKATAPNEMRGTRIDGGETHQLSKGQVVVIPAGVPHWFQAVSGNLLYYTVKVR
jgi:mannose-6-phosphate isomerase-like protein (cupin superfamily)